MNKTIARVVNELDRIGEPPERIAALLVMLSGLGKVCDARTLLCVAARIGEGGPRWGDPVGVAIARLFGALVRGDALPEDALSAALLVSKLHAAEPQ
jgi:hypothetical protein